MRNLSLVLVSLLMFVPPVFCIDKDKLSLHLRKALNLDSRTSIAIEDPISGGLGNLLIVPVSIGTNKYQVYITKDQKKYLWGQLFDATIDPDQARSDAMDLKNAFAIGSPTAPVTVVEYSDLQCPHCNKAHAVLEEELYKAYTKDQVRWIFKHFPLQGHDWAEPGAIACECAGQQNPQAFWEMTKILFHGASTGTVTAQNINEKVVQVATQLKLDVPLFKSCYESKATLSKVQANKNEGMAIGVAATPTLFIGGRMKRGFRDFEDVKVLIDEKLKEAGK